MPRIPSSVIEVNQIAITGPNITPIRAVPRFCSAKRAVSTTAAMRPDQRMSRPARRACTPSIALSTEIAGVITPSP